MQRSGDLLPSLAMCTRHLFSVLGIASLLLSACGDDGGGEECTCPAASVQTIGHRGSGDSSEENPLPENTLPSVLAAMENGADGVEIDIQLSADGVLVLMHDAEVDGTTDGTGCVNALTVEELKALDAGHPGAIGEGYTIPTFAEVLAAFDGGLLDVELKVETGHAACEDTDREATVAALLADLEGFPRERLFVSSFDAEILSMVREADPTIRLALIAVGAGSIEIAGTAGFDAVALLWATVGPSDIADAHARGLDFWVWTLDDEADAERLIDLGIDGVITNDVPTILALRERMCEDSACPLR